MGFDNTTRSKSYRLRPAGGGRPGDRQLGANECCLHRIQRKIENDPWVESKLDLILKVEKIRSLIRSLTIFTGFNLNHIKTTFKIERTTMAASAAFPVFGARCWPCQSNYINIQPAHQQRRLANQAVRSDALTTKQDNNAASIPPSQQQEALITLVRAATAATVFTALAATIPSPALASEWHPRRNLRRIRDSVLEGGARARTRQQENASRLLAQARKEQAAAQSAQAKSQDDLLYQVQSAAKRAYRKLQRTVRGESVFSIGVSGGNRPDPASYYPNSSYPSGPEASSLGWWVVTFALMGVAYAKWGDNLKLLWRRGPNSEKGRWVRDRSLGGKLVFVPDATDAPSSSRPLWQDDEDFTTELASVAAARTGGVGDARPTSSSAAAANRGNNVVVENLEPTWWAPPAPVGYVSASRKEDMIKQSKQTLRLLEDSKLRGEEYALSDLITLRRICHEGGGISVKPSTESGRDAILRAGVRFAMQASLRPNPSNDLGGYEPGRFISGLAGDLTVPSKRAITITHGEVAATCRGALIDAEAAFRAGDQNRVLISLGRLVATLAAFPLPQGSAESELVGRTIQAQTTLEFRRAVFLAAGSANIHIAPIVAEMMGFDPGQVMEQLKMQISVSAAQAAAQAVQRGEESE